MSECFCDRCNRMRLSADGWLRPCLLNEIGQLDLKTALREGVPTAQLRSQVRIYSHSNQKLIIKVEIRERKPDNITVLCPKLGVKPQPDSILEIAVSYSRGMDDRGNLAHRDRASRNPAKINYSNGQYSRSLVFVLGWAWSDRLWSLGFRED